MKRNRRLLYGQRKAAFEVDCEPTSGGLLAIGNFLFGERAILTRFSRVVSYLLLLESRPAPLLAAGKLLLDVKLTRTNQVLLAHVRAVTSTLAVAQRPTPRESSLQHR